LTVRVSPYRKAVVAGVAAVLTAVVSAITDGQITGSEWWEIGIAVAAACGVYKISNRPAE
jgi:hypothetical protein